tara:strand:+ start:56752 stop:58197 length:1446 start_codon:yes stop_codon:yes gene_type:complete
MTTARKNTLVMIMAGGKGSRLSPLTCHRSKPAVPFGGRYRIIDFVLTNFLNSGYRQIYVLTQYMASSLIKHLNRNWHISGFGQFIEVVPAQKRVGEFWYRGTADSVFQNLNLIRDSGADTVAIFGGDHIYKCAVDQMEAEHHANRADLTVAAFPVPQHEAHQFGVIDVDGDGRVIGFLEKPENPPSIPGRPGWTLVSMGNYFFRAKALTDVLQSESQRSDSKMDFGGDIVPRLVETGARVFTYDFAKNVVPGEPSNAEPYWRDVGTLDSYFQANMDLRSRLPALNVYNRDWRIRTAQRDYPPARFVRSHESAGGVDIHDSLVCEGSIVASARLTDALIGYDSYIHAGCDVEDSVILSGCDVGANSRLRRVLFDKNCKIDRNTVMGYDEEADRKRFPFVTESGIIVLPTGTHVPSEGPIQLAHDIEELLRKDPDTKEMMEEFSERYTISDVRRHSYISSGPRYQRYAGIFDDDDDGNDGDVE